MPVTWVIMSVIVFKLILCENTHFPSSYSPPPPKKKKSVLSAEMSPFIAVLLQGY